MFSCSSHRSVTILTSGSGGSEVTSLQRGKGQQPGQPSCILSPRGAAPKPLARPKCWVMLSSPLSSPSSGFYWSFAECQGLSVEAEGPLPHLFLAIPAVSMHVSMHFPLLLCISALPLLP